MVAKKPTILVNFGAAVAVVAVGMAVVVVASVVMAAVVVQLAE